MFTHHRSLSLLPVATLAVLTACVVDPVTFDQTDAMVDDGAVPIDTVPDTTAPETSITSSPAVLANSLVASFTFTANEAATFTCQVDGEAPAACTSPYTRSISAGAHTFQVTATDTAGNVDPTPAMHAWTIDVVPPVTSFTVAPPAIDNSTNVSFEFTASETATFECALDGTTFAACTSPSPVTGLTDGAHTYRVRATDAAGNVEPSPVTHTWTIDSSTPDTVIDTGPSGVSNLQNPSFTFSSPDAGGGATFECSLDGAAFTTCTSPRSYTGLNEGSHNFRVRVRDASNNLDPTPATRTWTIDLTGPETTIASGPSGAVSSTSASFTFTSNETGATFECSLDGATYAACPASHTISGLAQGSRTLQVRAVDLGGNRDSSPASRTWTVDTVAPVITISAPAAAAVTPAGVSVTFSVNESAVTTCRLDGAAAQACSSGVSYTLATGSHNVEVIAVDPATNVGMLTRTWTVDATNPDTTIATGPSGAVASTSASFTFTSDDGAATFECGLDGGGYAACPASHNLSTLAQGSHTLLVRAVDAVGNRDTSPASRTWTVDTVAPNTTIATAPLALTNSTSAMFDFTSEVGATFECNLDGTGFAACTDPVTFTVANGAHTLQVRAIDPAGNVDGSPASHSWTVDTVPPDTTIVSGPPANTATAAANFDFSSEAGATFQCNRDGLGYMACSDPYSVSVSEGGHTMQVRAVDAAGNADPTPASHSWTLDTINPDTTIATGPSGTVNSTTANFTFTSNEGSATFECNLDSGGYAACPATHGLTGLAQGSHTLLVRALDAAGNRDQSPASRTWSVDSVTPVVIITTPTTSPTGPRVTVTFTVSETGTTTMCRFDSGSLFACASGSAYNLPAGAHTLLVQATDAAGNVGSANRSWSVNCTDAPIDSTTYLFMKLEEPDGTQSLVNDVNASLPGYKGNVATPDSADPISINPGRFGRALNLPALATAPSPQFRWTRTATVPLSGWTVETWVRPAVNPPQSGWVVMNDVFADRVLLSWNHLTNQFGIYMYDWEGDMGFQRYLPATPGLWHHVVMTWDGTTATLYVDGVSSSVTTTTGTWNMPMSAFRFGAQGSTYLDFVGDMDSVQLSSRGWTASEVLDRYCPAQ